MLIHGHLINFYRWYTFFYLKRLVIFVFIRVFYAVFLLIKSVMNVNFLILQIVVMLIMKT